MIDIAPLTAEQFAACENPDEFRWTELVAGKILRLEPPDALHGRIVLNISKSIASYSHEKGDSHDGYACFELGLIVARNPDTVRCPAISYFSGGQRFAEVDKIITDSHPALVVEVASSADRRRHAAARVEGYLRWGVGFIWLADPIDRQIHVYEAGRPGRRLGARQALEGGNVLPGFRMFVSDVFSQPGV
jgi:Uma2 family endonuclease